MPIKIMVDALRHGQNVKEFTLLGPIIKRTLLYLKSRHFPYEGRIVPIGFEYRATIPGLLCHLLRFWLVRKKSQFSHNGN